MAAKTVFYHSITILLSFSNNLISTGITSLSNGIVISLSCAEEKVLSSLLSLITKCSKDKKIAIFLKSKILFHKILISRYLSRGLSKYFILSSHSTCNAEAVDVVKTESSSNESFQNLLVDYV